jgi:hypothetical protein
MPYAIWHHVSYPISGAIRVLVALVRMIQDLWARVSRIWLLGELGILLFSAPQDLGMLGVFCARFPPREANYILNSVLANYTKY